MEPFKAWLMAALLVVMTGCPTGVGGNEVSAEMGKVSAEEPQLKMENPAVKIPEKLAVPENPEKEVRIIVELEKEPAIELAIERGILYKTLPDSARNNLESAVVSNQQTVKAKIDQVTSEVTYFENFTTAFNGFSMEVPAGEVAKVADAVGVKAVYEVTEYQRPEFKPQLVRSKDLIQARQVWRNYNYKGESMVVSIIDTGIDPTHRDMVLTDDSTGELTEDEVESQIATGTLEGGQYFTPKVPYGYNYADKNNEIRDVGLIAAMHGMHVAGIVGANGNEENRGVQGVAPETQLLAMKVFSNDRGQESITADIIVKAIDDSIKLGADVINISIGEGADFVGKEKPEQQAVKRAADNGILVSASAGNFDMYGAGFAPPHADNPDYGVVDSPSNAPEAFSVASFENVVITDNSLSYEVDGSKAGRAFYLIANGQYLEDPPEGAYEVANAGTGLPEQFEGADFNGKYALVSSTGATLTEIGQAAQAAGAAGVLVYTEVVGYDFTVDQSVDIPVVVIEPVPGTAMKKALEAGQSVMVEFDGEYLEVPNPTAGQMSFFTSWGPPPNLDFKPEITAPGGYIFSTLNNDQYGSWSGTSMAAPHVSGGAALLFQRMEELEVTSKNRVQFVKNLMMNTADPVLFAEGQFVSPRRQGAGLMKLHDALSTQVFVTSKKTDEAKVALKEIKHNKFSFTLVAENLSKKAATYTVDVNVQVDAVTDNNGVLVVAPNQLGSVNISDAVAISAPKTVTVPAKGRVNIPIKVDVSAVDADLDAKFKNGYFVDGFVTLTDEDGKAPGHTPLVVPYFGFNGEWDKAPIFDDFAWEPKSYYRSTFLADILGTVIKGNSHVEEFEPGRFAFSPNGDGILDAVVPVFSLLRNAKEFEVNISTSSGKKLETIAEADNLIKNYSPASPFYFKKEYAWDGTIKGQAVSDGKYRIQLRAVIDYPHAEWQTIEFPVIVDTKAPVAKAAFNAADKKVKVTAFKDNKGGVGADRWEVFLNGKELTENPATPEDESLAPSMKSYLLKADVKAGDQLSAIFYDAAGNKTTVKLPVP